MRYEYNDYELIYLIKEENEEAILIMMDKYEPLIRSIASYYAINYKRYKVEYDDLVQEGRIGLLQAIKNFDDKKEVLFYTFALLCIKCKMLNYLRSSQSIKNYPLLSSCSLDDKVIDTLSDKRSNIDDIIGEKEIEEKIINFKNSLDFDDSLIFELKFNGFSYKDISVFLDINIKRVDNRLLFIREKLKKYLLNY